MEAGLSLTRVEQAGDGLLPALFTRLPLRFGRHASGLCACGRRALVLARCPRCCRDELAIIADDVARDADDSGADAPGTAVVAATSLQSWDSQGWLGGVAQLVDVPSVLATLQKEVFTSDRAPYASPDGLLFMPARNV